MRRHLCLTLTSVLLFWRVERGSWSNRPGLRVAACSCRPAPVPACLCLRWPSKKNATSGEHKSAWGTASSTVGNKTRVPRGLPKTPISHHIRQLRCYALLVVLFVRTEYLLEWHP